LELLRELQKIKAEREEEAERKKEASTSVSDISAEVALSNPLMGGGGGGATGAIKRRWDDDVVFRNQAPGDPTKVQKRFINDTIRNTFHKKFLKKYIN
jgi:protein CWC15